MSYSGTEPVELLALRARLCGITTEAQTIQELSTQMRKVIDPSIQSLVVKIWLADLRQGKDASRLLALFYLANDVVQLLRGSEQSLIYRYYFASAIAEAILVIRQKAPFLMPKVTRVIAIFKERMIFDTQTLSLLEKALQEDLHVVSSTIIPTIRTETTALRVKEKIKQLETELHTKYMESSSHPVPKVTKQPSFTVSQQRLVVAVQLPPPPIEDLVEAAKNLDKKTRILPRSQLSVNLDAEVVSRIRGYRIPLSARIHPSDSKIINVYQRLVKHNRDTLHSIDEKMQRRQKEEENTHFLLIPNRSTQTAALTASKRVEVLLRKEWNLRCEKQEIECAIYWHLTNILDHLVKRWERIQTIAEGIETEIQRRTSEKKQQQSTTVIVSSTLSHPSSVSAVTEDATAAAGIKPQQLSTTTTPPLFNSPQTPSIQPTGMLEIDSC